jgi:Phage portal protein, SPP1 Gp6-like.
MRTFNDLLEVGENEANRMQFVYEAISEHKSSDLYKTAQIADEYDRKQNRTIVQFQKLLYDATGRAIPDNVSANYKITSGFFNRFTTQQVQFLLGNGVTWEDETTKDYLGEDFDKQLQVAAKASLGAGVSFGFYNYDHLEVFTALEYVPLYDEENGALMAGIRFWQVDAQKPLRATLYETDGITEYIWEEGEGRILKDKRPYILTLISTGVDEAEIFAGENYPTFPIVPLWANPHRQSELVGLREQIDAYDLIKSGFCNTIDEASFIYWTINNAGGMDEIDLAEFVQRLKTIHAATVEDTGATAQANSLEAPHEGREALLDRLAKDMYADYMALNIDEIKGGANTATQIRAAYEPMNNKADQFEYCVLEFLQGILSVAGLEDTPTFTRSYLVNTTEEISVLLQAAQYLDDEYVTRRILTLLGDADKADEIIANMDEYDYQRMTGGEEPPIEE